METVEDIVAAPPGSLSDREGLEGVLEFETLIADLSSRFINLPPGDVDREIEEVQRRVCEVLGVDLSALWEGTAAGGPLTLTHFYSSREDLLPPMRGMSARQLFPWLEQEMLAGHTVTAASLDELPEAAALDRENLRLFGVRSNLTLPLSVGGASPVAALGFNTTHAERLWPDAVVKRLRLVAQVFGNALARKRADQALRDSEERLALAADSAEAGMWMLDYRTGVFWVTDRARAIFGHPAGETFDMRGLEAAVHPADWDRVREIVDRSARVLEAVDVEYRIARKSDGDVRWIQSRARPHLDASGQPERLMGVSIDVTERKRAEEALRASQGRLEAGAELAALAFYEVDFAAGTAVVDDRFADLCGIPPESQQGLGPLEFWLEHLHPDDRQKVLKERQALHEGTVERLTAEYRYLHPKHGERWLHHVARVTRREPSRHVLVTFGVLRDVTESRQREDALRQSYAEIERLKDRLQAESDYLKAEISVVSRRGAITGQSPAIQKVLRQVEQVAPTDSTVLVRGETGTGKELVAEALHRLSPRRSHVMVKVNCAALPSGLVESELFGRERGAFTGALTLQVGRFEVADGSTLFLDEIGELSLELQAKLLRVLETGEFERLGSPKTLKVDVRLIAATNRDLVEEIRKGRFREDLYYRLNVFPIRVPPLRERAEDVPLLVWTFLEECCSRMGKKITQVPRKTMEALQRHPWPGNVRELKNVIEYGAIVTTGEALTVPTLGEGARGAAAPATLAGSERELILRTLEAKAWRIKGPRGAAAALGINPSTLYSRMKKLGVQLRGQPQDGSSPEPGRRSG